jgi:flagellar basal body rod protein FlgG
MNIILVVLLALITLSAQAQRQPKSNQEKSMSNRASGTFEVKLNPQDEGPDAPVGRMSIDKQFQGDLAATSKGQMLMASSSTVKDSAGYVAIEKVTGTLKGRRGSFYLQHTGTMTRGVGELGITVIPDSGTDELVGLRGKMNIIIADGKHSYEFEYELGDKP